MTEVEPQSHAEPGTPVRGDASEKQLGFIRVLARKCELDDQALGDFVEDLTDCVGLEALSRAAASQVIEGLQDKARKQGVDLDSQPAASDKQLNFLKSLRRRAGLTDEAFQALLQEVAGVEQLEQVGRRDASKLIDMLLKRADQPSEPKPTAPSYSAASDSDERPPEPLVAPPMPDDLPF